MGIEAMELREAVAKGVTSVLYHWLRMTDTRGEPPKPNESPLWVFIKYIAKQAGLGRKKGPAKLRASA